MSNLKYSPNNTDETFPDQDQDNYEGKENDSEEDIDDFCQQTTDVIFNTLGKKILNCSKQEMAESISDILQKNENQILRRLKYQQGNYRRPQRSSPCINIICGCPSIPYNNPSIPMNTFQPPIPASQPNPYIYPPPSSYQIPPPISNIPLLPSPMQIPPSLPYPQSPVLNFSQSLLPPLTPTKKSHKKKEKSEKAEKKKKSDKKSHKRKKSEENDKSRSKSTQEFHHSPGQDFNGIIAFLTAKTGQNIHDNGQIEVTSNSRYQPSSASTKTYLPKSLLNEKVITQKKSAFGQPDFYAATPGENDFWIIFDFKSMRVELEAYTIKNTRYMNVSNIKNWVLEISEDKVKWKIIDRKNDYEAFKRGDVTQTFNVEKNKFVRYVRFRHTGDCWKAQGGISSNYIGIQSIEFFGKLKS